MFSFLINVGNCIDKEHYEMLFYKLMHNERILIKYVNSLDEIVPAGFEDISEYLKFNQFSTKEYQISIACQRYLKVSPGNRSSEAIIGDAIRTEYVLGKSGLSAHDQTETRKAVNFFYFVDVSEDEADEFGDDEVFKITKLDECAYDSVLEKIGMTDCKSIQDLYEKISDYANDEKRDEAILHIFTKYINHIKEASTVIGNKKELIESLKEFLKERFKYYNFFKLKGINSNIVKRLQFVEFINNVSCSTDSTQKPHLDETCLQIWKQITDNQNFESEYAKMLTSYKQKLASAERLINNLKPGDRKQSLPKMNIPSEKEINQNLLEESLTGDESGSADSLLDGFVIRPRDIVDSWNNTYEGLKKFISDMELKLNEFGTEMSKILRRKQHERTKSSSGEFQNHDIIDVALAEKRESEVTAAINEKLSALSEFKVVRRFSINDQLNIYEALESVDQAVKDGASALSNATVRLFLITFAAVFSAFAVHYFLAQNTIGLDISPSWQAAYSIIIAVLLLFTKSIPSKNFINAMKKHKDSLERDISKYYEGYTAEKNAFIEYLNLLNQLDYLYGYKELLIRSKQQYANRKEVYNLHYNAINKHLEYLTYFSNFILINDDVAICDINVTDLVDNLLSDDVVSSPLYWPQS